MISIKIDFPIENYKSINYGLYAEQNVVYHFTHEVRKHDSKPFDIDSDLSELNMSIKANRFTLVSGTANYGDTLEEKLNDYFARVHSSVFAYVSLEKIVYLMNKNEFRLLLEQFATLERDSQKNGSLLKVRCRRESKKMREWLESHSLPPTR